mmetsp:Transcript_54883/g.166772  ORF Transcript_54883/g.166772 Transcript_54883/m.166772 type:complete len:247 (-) Transcript_54883:761-1501(-)
MDREMSSCMAPDRSRSWAASLTSARPPAPPCALATTAHAPGVCSAPGGRLLPNASDASLASATAKSKNSCHMCAKRRACMSSAVRRPNPPAGLASKILWRSAPASHHDRSSAAAPMRRTSGKLSWTKRANGAEPRSSELYADWKITGSWPRAKRKTRGTMPTRWGSRLTTRRCFTRSMRPNLATSSCRCATSSHSAWKCWHRPSVGSYTCTYQTSFDLATRASKSSAVRSTDAIDSRDPSGARRAS